MKTFYTQLLKTFEDPNTVKQFSQKQIKPPRLIDFYAGQDRSPEAFEMLTLPALLLSWSVDYTPDTPVARLDFYLLYEQLRSTANFSLSKDKALEFFSLANEVDLVIKSIRTQSTGTLRLIHEELSPEHSVVDSYLLQYECPYYGKTKTRKGKTLPGAVEDIEVKIGMFKGVL